MQRVWKFQTIEFFNSSILFSLSVSPSCSDTVRGYKINTRMFIQIHIFVHFHIFKETNPQWKFISAIEDYIEYFALNILYICVVYTFWAANYISNLFRPLYVTKRYFVTACLRKNIPRIRVAFFPLLFPPLRFHSFMKFKEILVFLTLWQTISSMNKISLSIQYVTHENVIYEKLEIPLSDFRSDGEGSIRGKITQKYLKKKKKEGGCKHGKSSM